MDGQWDPIVPIAPCLVNPTPETPQWTLWTLLFTQKPSSKNTCDITPTFLLRYLICVQFTLLLYPLDDPYPPTTALLVTIITHCIVPCSTEKTYADLPYPSLLLLLCLESFASPFICIGAPKPCGLEDGGPYCLPVVDALPPCIACSTCVCV